MRIKWVLMGVCGAFLIGGIYRTTDHLRSAENRSINQDKDSFEPLLEEISVLAWQKKWTPLQAKTNQLLSSSATSEAKREAIQIVLYSNFSERGWHMLDHWPCRNVLTGKTETMEVKLILGVLLSMMGIAGDSEATLPPQRNMDQIAAQLPRAAHFEPLSRQPDFGTSMSEFWKSWRASEEAKTNLVNIIADAEVRGARNASQAGQALAFLCGITQNTLPEPTGEAMVRLWTIFLNGKFSEQEFAGLVKVLPWGKLNFRQVSPETAARFFSSASHEATAQVGTLEDSAWTISEAINPLLKDPPDFEVLAPGRVHADVSILAEACLAMAAGQKAQPVGQQLSSLAIVLANAAQANNTAREAAVYLALWHGRHASSDSTQVGWFRQAIMRIFCSAQAGASPAPRRYFRLSVEELMRQAFPFLGMEATLELVSMESLRTAALEAKVPETVFQEWTKDGELSLVPGFIAQMTLMQGIVEHDHLPRILALARSESVNSPTLVDGYRLVVLLEESTQALQSPQGLGTDANAVTFHVLRALESFSASISSRGLRVTTAHRLRQFLQALVGNIDQRTAQKVENSVSSFVSEYLSDQWVLLEDRPTYEAFIGGNWAEIYDRNSRLFKGIDSKDPHSLFAGDWIAIAWCMVAKRDEPIPVSIEEFARTSALIQNASEWADEFIFSAFLSLLVADRKEPEKAPIFALMVQFLEQAQMTWVGELEAVMLRQALEIARQRNMKVEAEWIETLLKKWAPLFSSGNASFQSI